MRKLLKRVEAAFAAAAFAEEGDVEEARRIVAEARGDDPRPRATPERAPRRLVAIRPGKIARLP